MRRVYLRGRDNIQKRLLVQAAAFNLALLMRSRHGVGTPHGLQGLADALGLVPVRLWRSFGSLYRTLVARFRLVWTTFTRSASPSPLTLPRLHNATSATGC